MDKLIELKSNEAVTTSLQVAEHFGKRHDKLLVEIERKYADLIGKGCTQNGGHPFFIKGEYTHPQNRQKYPIFYMNRDGFSLLVMGFTGKKALEWKVKYIQAFNEMEKLLTEKQTKTWLETRQESKLTRKSETEVIKKFVDYAREQGSDNADKYYVIFSKLANKTANITERDMATTFQLNSLTFIENIILHTIECQLMLGTEYHEIYQKCKKAIDEFKDLTDYESLAIRG